MTLDFALRLHVIVIVAWLPVLTAAADSTIDPAAKHAWGANTGWWNFRPSTADGISVGEAFLSGYAWAANVGWISFGDGTPANGHAYGNSSATDFGVNLDRHGNLSGHAYSANAGWVKFGWASADDPKRPRIDLRTGTFHGYAYGANIGWLNLDADTLRTDRLQVIDDDGDGIGDVWEIANFGDLDTAGSGTNFDNDPASDLEEYQAGTDPKSPGDYLRVTSIVIDGGQAETTLDFTTSESRRYRIDWSADLVTWHEVTELGEFDPDPGTSTTKTFTLPAPKKTFWQVTSIQSLPAGP